MNLLVTNAANTPAYSIIRALRPHAAKIVVTMPGKSRLASLGVHTAYSRHVDKRYFVPRASADWRAGRIQPDNTQAEELYIQRVEDICQREAIDTIYPSSDPLVYIFSKNKPRFAKQGVLIVGPDYDTLRIPLDKYESVLAAHRADFPTPRTHLPDSVADIKAIAEEFGPPWVIKPRFTAGSMGTSFVTRRDKLEQIWSETVEKHGKPLIQEFIPGDGRQNFYVVAGHAGEILSLMCPRVVRITVRISRNSTAAVIVSSQTPYRTQVEALVHEMGWQGSITFQTKIDARDGLVKFMEINPRPGESLWRRTESGINEPLMCVQLARGEMVESVEHYPEGAMLLDPASDLIRLPFELLDLFIFKVRTTLLGKQPVDSSNLPLTVSERFRAYIDEYGGSRRKIFSPYSRYLFEDPLPCLVWYLMIIKLLVSKIKTQGR